MEPLTMASIGIGIFSGILGSSSKRKAQRATAKAQNRQLQLAEAEYAGKMQDRQLWNERYGAVEKNMIDYVQSLDSGDYMRKAQGDIKKRFENSKTQLVSSLADRGFDVSGGVTAEAFTQLATQEVAFTTDYQRQVDDTIQKERQSVLNSNPQPDRPSTTNLSTITGNIGTTQASNYLEEGKDWANVGEFVLGSVNELMPKTGGFNNPNSQFMDGGTQVTFDSPTSQTDMQKALDSYNTSIWGRV